MFPKQITSTVTLYIPHEDSFARRVLHGCYYRDISEVVTGRTGEQVRYTMSVRIPITGYVAPNEWAGQSNSWSLNPRNPPYVIKGECPWVFSSGEGSEVIEFLKQYPDAKRADDIRVNDYGSQNMRHVVLSCR